MKYSVKIGNWDHKVFGSYNEAVNYLRTYWTAGMSYEMLKMDQNGKVIFNY